MNQEQDQSSKRGTTKICSVLFVDIVGYSKRTNSEQIALKAHFVRLWAEAIREVPPDEIMVVDTGDGAALTSLVEPEDSLRVALKLRELILAEGEKTGDLLSTRMGVNFGPMQFSTDVHGKPCIVGDAINIAQRIMSFADPGQIMISRSYYDTILPLNRKYAEMFCYLGKRADKHVRYHDVYALGAGNEAGTLGEIVGEGFMSIEPQPLEAPDLVEIKESKPASAPLQETKPKPDGPSLPGRVMRWFASKLSTAYFLAKLTLFVLMIYELIVLVPIIQKPELVKSELKGQIQAVKQALLGIQAAEDTLKQHLDTPANSK